MLVGSVVSCRSITCESEKVEGESISDAGDDSMSGGSLLGGLADGFVGDVDSVVRSFLGVKMEECCLVSRWVAACLYEFGDRIGFVMDEDLVTVDLLAVAGVLLCRGDKPVLPNPPLSLWV